MNLPQRPILITFDDGRLDSYRGADRILAEHGFRATMFVIAGFVEEQQLLLPDWDELRRMATSGRWDLQEHAGVGHVNVRYDAAGHEGPAYAYRQYEPGRGLESFEEYKRRVRAGHPVGQAHDVGAAARLQPPQRSPCRSAATARTARMTPASRASCRGFLRRHFKAVFMTDPPVYTKPSSSHSALGRIELNEDIATDTLYRWLRDRMSGAAGAAGEPLTQRRRRRSAGAAGPASG